MIASSSRTKLPVSTSLCYASVCIPIRSLRLQRRHRSSGVDTTGDVSEQLREVMRSVPQVSTRRIDNTVLGYQC